MAISSKIYLTENITLSLMQSERQFEIYMHAVPITPSINEKSIYSNDCTFYFKLGTKQIDQWEGI